MALSEADIARLREARGELRHEGQFLIFGDEEEGLRLDPEAGTFFDFSDETSGPISALSDRYKLNGHAPAPAVDVGLHPELADERALLGLLLSSPSLLAAVEEELTGAEFVSWQHVAVFSAMQKARAEDQEFRLNAVIAAFEGEEIAFSGLTPPQYVAKIIADAELSPDPEQQAHQARELARLIRSKYEQEIGEAPPWVEEEEAEPKPRQSAFGLVMWSEQGTGGSDSEYEFIVQGLIPRSEHVLIYGESQSGKSFFTFDMSMCLARGVPFYGRKILRPMGVIYAAYEAGKGFKDRLRAYRNHYQLSLDELPFALLTKPIDLWSNAQHTKQFIEEINWIASTKFAGIELGAVVIDTHNAATPGASEVDSKEVSEIIRRYHTIKDLTGAGCWIVSHKNAEGRMRGNQQLYNRIETALDISRVLQKRSEGSKEMVPVRDQSGHAVRSIRVHKQREGRDGDEWKFILAPVEVGRVDAFGEKVTSCVPQPPALGVGDVPLTSSSGKPFFVPQGWVDLKPREREVFHAFITALEMCGKKPPSDVRAPPGTIAVQWGEWHRERVRQLEGTEEDANVLYERAKSNIAYAREKWNKRIIDYDKGWYWRTSRRVSGFDRPPLRAEDLASKPDHLTDEDVSALTGMM